MWMHLKENEKQSNKQSQLTTVCDQFHNLNKIVFILGLRLWSKFVCNHKSNQGNISRTLICPRSVADSKCFILNLRFFRGFSLTRRQVPIISKNIFLDLFRKWHYAFANRFDRSKPLNVCN